MKTKSFKLVMAALFAAICFVLTTFVKIPVVIGYINLGDCAVLLGAICLGPLWGAVSGAIGSSLADLLAGYAAYVPATFIIKFLMALAAGYIFKMFKGKTMGAVLGSVLGEVIMVLGYFIYEMTVLGYGLAAAASVPFNLIQGTVGIIIAVLMAVIVKKHKLFYE